MNDASIWLLWQLADSAFPTGGFAHSAGLEAAWQQGEIRSRADMADFARASLTQAGHSAVPFVLLAHRHPERLDDMDLLCDSFLTSHVANRASRLQGQALLAAAERSFSRPPVTALREAVVARSLPGHLAPIFGAVTRHLELSDRLAARLFLFWTLRAVIASAVRLGILGPMDAQALQFQLTSQAEDVAERCSATKVREFAQTAPLIELFQGAQDRLYSRLFQS